MNNTVSSESSSKSFFVYTGGVPRDVTHLRIVASTIQEAEFSHRRPLVEVEFGAGIKAIPPRAFLSCSSLKKVCIVNTIEKIGDQAFRECKSLTMIDSREYRHGRCH